MIRFEIPAVPPSKNDTKQHWRIRWHALETWTKWMALCAPRMDRPLEGPLEVRITYYTKRPRDAGNMHELLLDAMRGRVIVDDDWWTVAELRLRRRPCGDSGERTEVELVPYDDPTCPVGDRTDTARPSRRSRAGRSRTSSSASA